MGKGLSIDIDRIKVMVLNTMQSCLTRSKPELFLGEEKVAYKRFYMCLGVETWRLSFNKENKWKDFERSRVSMIAHMIRSNIGTP